MARRVILGNVSSNSPGPLLGVILEDTVTLTSRKAAWGGLAALAVGALTLAGCAAAPTSSGSTGAKSSFLPCMVSDDGGFDDHSFNQLGLQGLQSAAKDLGVKEKHVQSNSADDYTPNINSMISAGCNLIVTLGFNLSAATDTTAPTARILDETVILPDAHRRLADDQEAAVRHVAGSRRRIDLLVGPAGSGKTTTLAALRQAWEREHGRGAVIGLAPSSTAAANLAGALGIACENTAKWLHESTGPAAASRTAITERLVAMRDGLAGPQSLGRLRTIDTTLH